MKFKIEVEIEVERNTGLFASRDEIEEELVRAIDNADPGYLSNLGAQGTSEYEIIQWNVLVS